MIPLQNDRAPRAICAIAVKILPFGEILFRTAVERTYSVCQLRSVVAFRGRSPGYLDMSGMLHGILMYLSALDDAEEDAGG